MDTSVINIFWMIKLMLVIKSKSITSEPVNDYISLSLVGPGESAQLYRGVHVPGVGPEGKHSKERQKHTTVCVASKHNQGTNRSYF